MLMPYWVFDAQLWHPSALTECHWEAPPCPGAGAAPETGNRARQRSYYCTAKQQAIIARRAKAAGMTCSAFMVACALHDGPASTDLLATTPEQKALLDQPAATGEAAACLTARKPDLGMSVIDALELLCRLKVPENEP